jgi:hypothetical protein
MSKKGYSRKEVIELMADSKVLSDEDNDEWDEGYVFGYQSAVLDAEYWLSQKKRES